MLLHTPKPKEIAPPNSKEKINAPPYTKVKKNLIRFMNLEEKANLIDACSPI